jgi:hypothetical protein
MGTSRAPHSAVVPAKAGTHNHKWMWSRTVSASVPQEKSRGMGPGSVRNRALGRDDEHGPSQRIQLSSPGSTGRSSTPRLPGLIERPLEYWIPAFAGMTSCGN